MKSIWRYEARGKGFRKGIVLMVFSLSLALIGIEGGKEASATVKPAESPALLEMGRGLFKTECVVCHGSEGKGDGTAAYLLFPKPRDLTRGIFKVRSTPTGEPPTDEDLFRTITNGLPGSAMPSFVKLSEEERWALVYHVKKLAGLTEMPERVIQVPAQVEPTQELVANGRALYQKLQCWECHGQEGRGDGPLALITKDEWGYPAPPNNFTRGIYKGGGRSEDIYLRFLTGMDGTPMPSYEASISSEKESWALVHYVKSLAGPKVAVQPGTGLIVAQKTKGPLPTLPTDPAWEAVPSTTIPLMLLWQRQKSADGVEVRAVHDGDSVSVLLSWEDSSPQARFVRHEDFTDGAAVQFSLASESPLFTMGAKGGPVNIWYWRADKQVDMGKFQDLEDVYPNMAYDDYLLAPGWYPKNTERWPDHRPILSAAAHNPTYVTGWGAGNLVSNPWLTSAVQDLNAEGFGTLSAQGKDDQNVRGVGFWLSGTWKVVFQRSLKDIGDFDVPLKPGKEVPISFAVWDGSTGDRDGQKAVTTWYSLKLQ